MNWINNALFGLIARHALTLVAGWLAAKGILGDDDAAKAQAAVLVLAAVGHSLWSKRETIIAELKALLNGTPLPLLALACACLVSSMCSGCKTYQVAHATSGSGLNLNASVPIPLSGGSTLLGLNMIAGFWKMADVIQPTGTNATISPSVAVNIGTTGNAGANGNVGTSGATNGVAGIDAADKEHLTLLTGSSTLTSSNLNLTTGK